MIKYLCFRLFFIFYPQTSSIAVFDLVDVPCKAHKLNCSFFLSFLIFEGLSSWQLKHL